MHGASRRIGARRVNGVVIAAEARDVEPVKRRAGAWFRRALIFAPAMADPGGLRDGGGTLLR